MFGCYPSCTPQRVVFAAGAQFLLILMVHPQWTLHVEMAFRLLTSKWVRKRVYRLSRPPRMGGVYLLVEHLCSVRELGVQSPGLQKEVNKVSLKTKRVHPFSDMENKIGTPCCHLCAPPPACAIQAHFAECSLGAGTFISLMPVSRKSRRCRFPKFLGTLLLNSASSVL